MCTGCCVADRPYRVLVTGSRDWTDAETIRRNLIGVTGHLDALRRVVVIDGACPKGGADDIAHKEAKSLGWGTERYPAEDFGSWPFCGPLRNAHMVSLGADVCLAFPGPNSSGTWDCVKKANAAGIRVIIVPPRPNQAKEQP